MDSTRHVIESLGGKPEIPPWDDVPVTGSRPRVIVDETEVGRALKILWGPDEWHELRALPSGRGQVVKADEALPIVREFSDEQVYYSVNPVETGSERAKKTTVSFRRWFPVDVDTVKPKDAGSTEEEKIKAASVAGAILDHLLSIGWPAPLLIDSGNGWHLLYRIDLPADPFNKEVIKRCVYALGEKFSTAEVVIDRVTHDAARVFKLPGTMARKGPDTPERPHRMCRLVYEPDRIEIVPIELLKALGSPPKEPQAQTNGKHETWDIPVTEHTDLTAYVQGAIDQESRAMAFSVPGNRNTILNTAAFNLGQMTSWPEMSERDTKAILEDLARKAGLPDDEIAKTIPRSWADGAKEPRKRPEKSTRQDKKSSIPPGKFIIWASSVTTRKVQWLDPGKIPLGKMTTFAGQTGLGKTFTICDLAARVTTGGLIPFGGGACYNRGKVLIISAEDDADDTIVPRFMELGGDLSRLALLSPESEEHFSLSALEILNGCIGDMGSGVLMVAIDPPTSYLGKVDDHRNAELRGLLTPLKRWARDQNVALVFVTHVNKPGAHKIEALSRVMGSVAWVAAVRSAHMFCPDPEKPSRHLYLPLKVNNAKKRKGLAYEIVSTQGDMATLRWLEEVSISADDAMNQIMPRKSAGQSAVEWLMDRFREKTEWMSEDLRTLSRDAGLSFHQVFKSPEVNALPIVKKPRIDGNGVRYWVWIARDGWPPPKQPETSESSESTNVSANDVPPY